MDISTILHSQAKALSAKLGQRKLGLRRESSHGVGSLSLKNNSSFASTRRCQYSASRFSAPVAVQSMNRIPFSGKYKSRDSMKLFVGLPMDAVSKDNALTIHDGIEPGLGALQLTGVDGVELPVWWGHVEGEAMGQYDWSGYLAIAETVKNAGLKLHVSLCFHASKCPSIPLPKWVSDIGRSNPDVFFADSNGKRCRDCLSLAVDDLPVLDGATPVQVYRNFCESFKASFLSQHGSIVKGVSVGLGPNGQLRYPSNQKMKRSRIPGVGEFQCYDKYMLNNLKRHAEETGQPLWGLTGPHDAPSYNQSPDSTGFFKNDKGSWESPYGDFFLFWYSDQLLNHADRLLSMAASVFHDSSLNIYGNLPLVHAWYNTRSHAAELTAGYYNTSVRDGYDAVAQVFAKHSCSVLLPGMDLSDEVLASEACSKPETLFRQITQSCRKHGVELSGQDGTNSGAINKFEGIRKKLAAERSSEMFTYHRMGHELFSPEHFPKFQEFAMNLSELRLGRTSDDDYVVPPFSW